MVIKKDIEQKNMDEMDDDCEINGIDVQNDEIYDYESFQQFKEDIYTMFDCYSEAYKGEKCIDLNYLNSL